MSTTVATATEPQASPPLPAPRRMTYEEFLAWDYEGGLTEWVNGEVIFHMPAKEEHQRVFEFLIQLLGPFILLFQLGKLKSAPFAMRALPDGPGREPDLLFVATQHLDRLTRDQLNGPADLVVEIISDDSVSRDRDEKFAEYQEAGVREYWILDPRPRRCRADFYVLDAQGRYQPVPLGADNVYRSTVLPNFWLKVDWLWQESPNALAALAEIVGPEQVVAALRAAQTGNVQSV